MSEPGQRNSSKKRVLIVRIGAMGDVLHAMPAVMALRAAHPDWELGWVVEPRWLPLLRANESKQRGSGMPLVDRVYLAATRDWKRRPFSRETLGQIRSLTRDLREGRFDLCVDMQGSIRSAVIGRLAGARKFAGPAAPREREARWIYGERVAMTARHVIEQGCELLGAATGERLSPAKVALPVDAATERECNALLERISAGRPFVLIAPSAGWGAKEWPPERYGLVARGLAEAGLGVLVNAGSAEDVRARQVVEASGGRAVAVPGSMARLIAIVRRASLVIAGDTGPLHLAAALERPVVAIFGPTDPARNGPYGTMARVLRSTSSQTDHSRHADPEAGMLEIRAGEVLGAAMDLLQGETG